MELVLISGKRIIDFRYGGTSKRPIRQTPKKSTASSRVLLVILAPDRSQGSFRTSVDEAFRRIATTAKNTGSREIFLGFHAPPNNGTSYPGGTRVMMKAIGDKLKAAGKYRVTLTSLKKLDALALEVDQHTIHTSWNEAQDAAKP
ncbi:MAG: hypothetical protein ACE5PO_03810 [Candidatus Bathyarchaeia archaeon]